MVTKGITIKFPPIFFKGFPDEIGLAPGGKIVFFETKANGKKENILQGKVHAKLRRLGFEVWVVDSYEAIDGYFISQW